MNSRTGAIAALFITLITQQSHAQEVGLNAFVGSSSNRYVRSIKGLSASASFIANVTVPFGFRLEYSKADHHASFPSTLCDRYWPDNLNCTAEEVAASGTTKSISYDAVVLPRIGSFTVGAAVGWGRSRMTMIARGVSTGRSTGDIFDESRPITINNVFRPNSSHRSLIFAYRMRRVNLQAEFRHGRIDYKSCATDVGTPFCSQFMTNDGRLGATLRL